MWCRNRSPDGAWLAIMVWQSLTIQRPFKTLLKKSANLSRNSRPAMARLTVISLSAQRVQRRRPEEFMEKNVKLTQCIRYVEDAVGIVEDIISRNPKPAK